MLWTVYRNCFTLESNTCVFFMKVYKGANSEKNTKN